MRTAPATKNPSPESPAPVHGLPFLTSLIYLTLLVAVVVTVLERGYDARFVRETLRRWVKFLLLLGALGVAVQILTFLQG